MTIRGLATAAAMITASTFTAWALYITLVEHPARLDSGAAAGRAQFRPSYRRAAPWQASFAVLAFVAGLLAAALTVRWEWLLGARDKTGPHVGDPGATAPGLLSARHNAGLPGFAE